MSQTPEQFFTKNMRWFALAFFLLFFFKSVQSCNRNMGTRVTEKKTTYTIDSLTKKADLLERTLELCQSGSKLKDDFINSNKSLREKELEVKKIEAAQKIQINNNFTIQKDSSNKK